jgi:general secretion pathway protein L
MKEKSVQRLLVLLPPHRQAAARGGLTSATLVTYVVPEPGGGTRATETPIALLPKAGNVELVFDSSDLLITAIEAPKLSDAKLRQALPNLLEDRLLSEATDCHFAFEPPARASGATTLAAQPKLAVAAIDRGLLTRALDALEEVGLRPRAAYSDIYTIPPPGAGVLNVRVDRGRGVVRSGRHDGFAFDFEDKVVPAPLALAVRQLGIKRVVVYGRDAAKLAALAGELGVQMEAANRDVDLEASDTAVNLLQGSFAPGGLFGGLSFAGMPRITWARSKAPLIWLGVAVGVFIAGMNAYYLKLQNEVRTIRAEATAAFRSNFPTYTSVSDDVGILARLTESEMNKLRARAGLASPSDFSVLNAQLAQLLSGAPVGSVAGVEYRDGKVRVKFKPGTASDPGLQNSLRGQAIQQGLELRFEQDGSARLAPSGG